jgi:hypothetical protein
MSSFTKHTSISPTDDGKWITTQWFRYYIGEEGSDNYVDVPADFVFDGASVPNIFGIFIQKVEPDTIMSACLHDYIYIHRREYGRIVSDIIFLESLIIYNIPRLLRQKKYILAFMSIFKYIIMTVWLILFSWFVRYKIPKKVLSLFK